RQGYAVQWFRGVENAMEIAKKISPINHVRAGLPPVFVIHGTADRTVPPGQSSALVEALNKVGVPAELSVVEGGGHGGFDAEQRRKIWLQLTAFLAKNKIIEK